MAIPLFVAFLSLIIEGKAQNVVARTLKIELSSNTRHFFYCKCILLLVSDIASPSTSKSIMKTYSFGLKL